MLVDYFLLEYTSPEQRRSSNITKNPNDYDNYQNYRMINKLEVSDTKCCDIKDPITLVNSSLLIRNVT